MKTFNIIHRETIRNCLHIWNDDLGHYDHSTFVPHIFQANQTSQAWESFIKEVMTRTKFYEWKNNKMVKDWQARGKAKTWVLLYLYSWPSASYVKFSLFLPLAYSTLMSFII